MKTTIRLIYVLLPLIAFALLTYLSFKYDEYVLFVVIIDALYVISFVFIVFFAIIESAVEVISEKQKKKSATELINDFSNRNSL